VRRLVAILAAVVVVALLFGAAPADPATADPVRLAALRRVATTQAAEADAALQEAQDFMDEGLLEAGRGQAAVLSGNEDPAVIMDSAALSFEAAANPIEVAQAALSDLAWTLRVLDPEGTPPTLTLRGADMVALGAQWRATGLPLSAAADLRRAAEATLEALGDALAALARDDAAGALEAVAEAEVTLEVVRTLDGELPTMPFWIDTVEALLAATADIAEAVLSGDPVALAEAQTAYDAAAADATRADQALAIALGEEAARITAPASATSGEAQRQVVATRVAIGALSILP
jgi:hypothetical protein